MKKQDLHENEALRAEETSAINLNTDENAEGTFHLEDPVDEAGDSSIFNKQLEDANKKASELNDKYLRLVAEFDNFKKRNAKERIELIQTAGKDVITDLLDVLDDNERAQTQMEKTDDVVQIKEGVQLVFSKLQNLLTSKGLKPMETMNKDFDADIAEAITEIDAGDEMKGKVVAEVQKGYYLNDKIIRFAKVVVGK